MLPGMTVGGLAGHLARSVLQVEWFLDGQVSGAEPVSPVRYGARLADTSLPDSALNFGVHTRSEVTAAVGTVVVAERAQAALGGLSQRLGIESADRWVAVLHRPDEEMLLDGYLQARCVEQAVHLDDLANRTRQGTHWPFGSRSPRWQIEAATGAVKGQEVVGLALVATVRAPAAGEPGGGAFDAPAVSAQVCGVLDAAASNTRDDAARA